MPLILNLWGREYRLNIVEDRYSNNNSLYLGLIDADTKEPFANFTVNLSDGVATDNCQYVDTNNLPELADLIEEYKLGTYICDGYSGYCSYPLYNFDEKEVSKYLEVR